MRDLYQQLMKASGYGQGPTLSEEEEAGEEETKKAESSPEAPAPKAPIAPSEEASKAPVMAKSFDAMTAEYVRKHFPMTAVDGAPLGKSMEGESMASGSDIGQMRNGSEGKPMENPGAMRDKMSGMPKASADEEKELSPERAMGGDDAGGGDLGQEKKLNKAEGYILNGHIAVGTGMDKIISKNMDGAGTFAPEPTMALYNTPLMKSRVCKACNTSHMAMLSTCPQCGSEHGGYGRSGSSVVMNKSVADSLTPPRNEPRVYVGGFLPVE